MLRKSSGHQAKEKASFNSRLVLLDQQIIDTTIDIWEVADLSHKGPIKFSFKNLSAMHPDTILRLKQTISYYLESKSIAHSFNIYNRFLAFYKSELASSSDASIEIIQLNNLLNWRAKLNVSNVWQLGVLRILLETAESIGSGFCSDDGLAWLEGSIIPGNPKGVDVRTRDPNRGAFSTIEVETLNAALNAAYREGEINLSDYAAGHILLAFGVRSRQLAALKERDLIVAPAGANEKRYVLKIPQAKQRGEVTRGSFRTRPCDRRIGLLLEGLIAANASMRRDPKVAPDDWPMFINPASGDNPPGFAYHRSAVEIATRIQTSLVRRTGIPAHSKRFRHTLAQNMADDGASKFEIAEALGHTDTQQVGVYIAATPEMVSRLNHLSEDLAPIMQAFAGQLIPSDSEEAHIAPKEKRLHDRSLEMNGDFPLGHCGQHSFCDLAKPIGCYTCISFRPWNDGPHEEVLAKLQAERQAKIDRGLHAKIYTINDRTIQAVLTVCGICRQLESVKNIENRATK